MLCFYGFTFPYYTVSNQVQVKTFQTVCQGIMSAVNKGPV